MTEIKIEITDQQAREWRVALADRYKRRIGREWEKPPRLDDLCRLELLQAVADELTQQAIEAESEVVND